MAYDTKDMKEIADLLNKVESKHIVTPQEVRQQVQTQQTQQTQKPGVLSESVSEKLDYGKEQSESTNIQESSHGDPDDKNKPFDGITAKNRLNYIDNIVFTYPDKSLEWYKKKILDGRSFQDYKKLTTYELFNLKRFMSSFKDKDTSSDDLKEDVSLKDGDINNDGKKDKTDSYLLKRRKEINKALKEAGLGESINYYQDKLEYIVEPNYELHAVDIDEERGDIEIEFTYKKTRDTYSISYNHFDGNMSVGIASDGDENYKSTDADDFRKSDYHDDVYTALELEIDSLSRFVDEEPDDRDYEDDERPGRMG